MHTQFFQDVVSQNVSTVSENTL